MAAVTEPVGSFPPPGTRRRSRVLLWGVVAWGVVVAGVAVWSVGHSPATVPEQRTIGQAMPDLQQAAGAVFAAAAGPGRAVVLGGLQVASGCRVTPVRRGDSVTRDVTVFVRAGEQGGDIAAIAAALPARYQVELTPSRGGTQFALHADAGNFIGIDMTATIGDSALTLRLSTGCRPIGDGGVDRADPSAGPAPAVLGAALTALEAPETAARLGSGGSAGPIPRPTGTSGSRTWPSGSPVPPGAGILMQPSGAAVPSRAGVTVQSVRCPAGGTAGTYTVDGVAAPKDWAQRLGRVASGAAVVRSDTNRWAYRTGNDSVVVIGEGQSLRVSASTSC